MRCRLGENKILHCQTGSPPAVKGVIVTLPVFGCHSHDTLTVTICRCDSVASLSLQQIHVRTVACAGRSCICGVAVQRDYDAVSLSVCEGQGVLPPEVRVLSDHGLQPSTTVTRTPDGREYMVWSSAPFISIVFILITLHLHN